jgi:hypothetical protein
MSRTLALCDEVSTPNVMPHLSSTLGNRASTSAPPEPTRPPTISYISTQVEAEGPQGRLNPKDYEMSIENHRQSPARNGGLEHLDSPFAICQDALQRIKDLRTDALSLRSQIREKRTKLMEKQRAQQMADDLLLQRLRQQFLGQVVKHNSLVPGGKTIEDLMQDCNNARDEYGPLEDDYNRPEDQLDRQEFRLIAMENEFYKQSKENISQGPIRSPNDQEDIAYALREDCFSRGLIDESGKATDFPSQGQESYPARLKHDSTTCDSCGSENIAGYYYCSTCPRDGYGICFSCTDKGLSCPGQDHDLLKRIFDTKSRIFVDEELYTPARGLRVFVKGQLTSGIGDTGSEETIISEERCRQMGEQVIPDPMWITLGNQRRMYSLGKVNIPVAFPDTPGQIVMVLARVVKQFSFDLLLGNPFLEATQTMEKYIHRFVCCLFPTRNLWSFYRVGETRRRFKATMGNDILFEALADTGSRRNIMRADWAFQQRFEVRSKPENLGWITFPTGPEEATIGQVHTHISLPDGKLVPTIFDVLPTCRLSVVLGIDFVLDSNIYQNYASSFFDLQTDGDEEASCCMGMGRIPWFVKVGNSIKNAVYKTSKETTCESKSNTSDLTSSF